MYCQILVKSNLDLTGRVFIMQMNQQTFFMFLNWTCCKWKLLIFSLCCKMPKTIIDEDFCFLVCGLRWGSWLHHRAGNSKCRSAARVTSISSFGCRRAGHGGWWCFDVGDSGENICTRSIVLLRWDLRHRHLGRSASRTLVPIVRNSHLVLGFVIVIQSRGVFHFGVRFKTTCGPSMPFLCSPTQTTRVLCL